MEYVYMRTAYLQWGSLSAGLLAIVIIKKTHISIWLIRSLDANGHYCHSKVMKALKYMLLVTRTTCEVFLSFMTLGIVK